MAQSPAELSLRAAGGQDAEAWSALMNLPGVRWGTSGLPFASIEDSRQRLQRFTQDDRLILGFVGDNLVGSASLNRLKGRRSHIGSIGMVVHDDWTGRGIGTALMAAVIDLADSWLGLHRLQLEVNTDNLPALALYRRFGFEVEGTLRDYMFRGGAYVDAFTMARLR